MGKKKYEVYYVEEILEKKVIDNVTFYLVKWEGYES